MVLRTLKGLMTEPRPTSRLFALFLTLFAASIATLPAAHAKSAPKKPEYKTATDLLLKGKPDLEGTVLGTINMRGFLASNHPELLQSMIDRVTERFLATPIAQQTVGKNPSAEKLRMYFGMSLKAAERFSGKPYEQRYLTLGETKIPIDKVLPQRKFFFTLTEPENLPWESYTDEKFTTMIFLNRSDLTNDRDFETKLLKIIVHEAAILHDDRANLLPWYLRNKRSIPVKEWKGVQLEERITEAMRAMRALRFEAIAFPQIQLLPGEELQPVISAKPSEKQCNQLLQRMAWNMKLGDMHFAGKDEATRRTQIERTREALAYIQKYKLCLKFSELDLDLESPFMASGPRPRAGGGDWSLPATPEREQQR